MDSEENLFRLYNRKHPLEWWIHTGVPAKALVLVCTEEPKIHDSAKHLHVIKEPRNDGKWNLKFRLTNMHYQDLFDSFCKDMIASSNSIKPSDGLMFVSNRYQKWTELFKQSFGKLQKFQIQGLIGEIIAIRDILIPKYGETETLKSWMNSKSGKQDFICGDAWYEIKTAICGNKTIKVSSLEQLDRDDEGELILVILRETSEESKKKITINTIYNDTIKSFTEEKARTLFIDILSSAGYSYEQQYDDYSYEVDSISKFKVTGDFPRLRRSKIKERGIADAEYEIYIESLNIFEVR